MKAVIFILDYCYSAYLKLASYVASNKTSDNAIEIGTVILVPGVYENWYFFRKLSLALREHGLTVIHSGEIYESSSIREDAAKLATYIHKNRLKKVILLGHSSGGIVSVECMSNATDVDKAICIATPFYGVNNGKILRTKRVRELLSGSEAIQSIGALLKRQSDKVVSIYPKYDNQVWSRRGSIVSGAKNMQVNTSGHHLILRSNKLVESVLREVG